MSPRVGVTLSGRYPPAAPDATGGMGQVWEAVDSGWAGGSPSKVLKAEYPRIRNSWNASAPRLAPSRDAEPSGHRGRARLRRDGDRRRGPHRLPGDGTVNGEPLNSVLKRTGRLSLRHTLDMRGARPPAHCRSRMPRVWCTATSNPATSSSPHRQC